MRLIIISTYSPTLLTGFTFVMVKSAHLKVNFVK